MDSRTPLLSHGRWHSGKPDVTVPCQTNQIPRTSLPYGFLLSSWAAFRSPFGGGMIPPINPMSLYNGLVLIRTLTGKHQHRNQQPSIAWYLPLRAHREKRLPNCYKSSSTLIPAYKFKMRYKRTNKDLEYPSNFKEKVFH